MYESHNKVTWNKRMGPLSQVVRFLGWRLGACLVDEGSARQIWPPFQPVYKLYGWFLDEGFQRLSWPRWWNGRSQGWVSIMCSNLSENVIIRLVRGRRQWMDLRGLLNEVTISSSGRLTIRNMIDRSHLWNEHEIKSRIVTWDWLSLHSSRPSMTNSLLKYFWR